MNVKKIFLLLIIFLINFDLISQTNLIYDENFNDSNTEWDKNDKNEGYSNVQNGVLMIKSSPEASLHWFGSQIFINYKMDFTIETQIKQVSGKNSQGYGIIWGSRGWENSYFFLISSSGYYSVGAYFRSEYEEIQPWTKCENINPIRTYNTLAVEKIDKTYIFYVNDDAVYTTNFRPFYGQIQGFMLQGDVNCYVDYLKVYNDKPDIDIAEIQFKGSKKNIGPKVNCSETDIAPIISADGKILYFARGNYKGNYNGTNDEADIWYSEKLPDGSWSAAKNIGPPLNNTGVNVVVNAMPDGNTLFLEGLYNSDGSFRSDQGISVTHRTANGWAVPKQVKIDNFYNKNIYETYFFTTDQRVLIMSIERDDTYGDKDLYVSFRKSDGSYSEPKNMGPVLNTFGDEGTPFMAPDNKTLYFSTSGMKGFGSNDIFMSKRLDDTWLNWSKPKNLGEEINTSDWDTYLSLSARGDTAFLVSTANSYGYEDIFIIAMESDFKPEPVVLIKGKVLDYETKKPVGAEITYQDLATGEEVGIAQSDPKTGAYQIVLPYGKLYGFRAEADKYIAQNENIDLRKVSGYQEITKNLYLMKMEVGEVIVLNNVFFEKASPKLINTSYSELDRIVKIMKDNPTMKVELMGHTDNRGDKDLLMKLSQDRVDAVKNYLVSKGISATRIKTSAYGGTQTIHKNDTEFEHSKNRRVEFKILEL